MSSRRLSRGFAIIQEVPGNDDEAEREHLRAQREKRRLSHTPTARRRLSGAAPHAEPDKNILEIYDKCIKLSAENKINRQNTWDLSLIDHIDDVIGNTGANTNFQKASCTLDASVKIYSYRVDSVHHDMFKVLGGLNRTDPDGSEGEEQQPAEIEEGDDQTAKASQANTNRPRQRNRQNQLNCHLELKAAALAVPLSELLFEVDPMFQRTASSFDEGGAKGLLMNQLTVGQRCHIVFDFSADLESDTNEDNSENIRVEVPPSFLQHWSNLCLSELQISPLTSRLRAALNEDETQVNVVEEDTPDQVPATFAEENDFEDSHHVQETYDVDDDDDDDDGGHAFNLESNDPDMLDHIEPSPVQDTTELLDTESQENIDPDQSNPNEVQSIDGGLFSPVGSRRATAIFSAATGLNMPHLQLNKNWAGPGIGTSHWRFKGETQPNASNQESEMEVLSSRFKKARISHEIDFRGPPVPESDLADPPRASNILSKTAYTKSSTLNHLLPTDLHISHSVLFRLFHRPNFFLRPSSKNALADGNAERVGTVAGDGPTNFVTFNGGFGDDDDDDDFAHHGFQDNDDDRGMFASEFNFVAQPTTAEKIEIDFAKSMKKVDIKAVKQCLWSTLSEKTQNAPPLPVDNGEQTSTVSDPEPEQQSLSQQQNEWPSFKEMIQSVPVPESSKEAMSVQLYFICLLHLANENDLVFKTRMTPLGDFSIGRRADSSN